MTADSDRLSQNHPVFDSRESDPGKVHGWEKGDAPVDCAHFTTSKDEMKGILLFLCRSGYNLCRILAIVIPCFTALHLWDGNDGILACMILIEIFLISRWIAIGSLLHRREGAGNEYSYTLTDQGLECEVRSVGGAKVHYWFDPARITHFKESASHLYFTHKRTVFFIRKSALSSGSQIPDYIRTSAARNTVARKRGGWNVQKPPEDGDSFGTVSEKSGGGKAGKIASLLMTLSILSLLVSTVLLVFTTPAGGDITRQSWVYLPFLPIPVATVVMGILLKVRGTGKTRTIVVGAIVTFCLLALGVTFGFVR